MNEKRFNPTYSRRMHGQPSPLPFSIPLPNHVAIGLLLLAALLAFEIFNFDTTRYALENLLGDVRFAGLRWATILAIAFCAIDFAGLLRFFVPDKEDGQPTEMWYLMGAWLLGATMNAVMTWWAVSLTLLNHDLGNEVLSRAQLLDIVPVFVAALVWLTRILFIGAFTVAGGYYLSSGKEKRPSPVRQPVSPARPTMPQRAHLVPTRRPTAEAPLPATDEVPVFLRERPQDVSPPEVAPAYEERQPEEPEDVRPAPAPRRTRPQPASPGRRPPIPMRAQGRSRR